ncbi:MAG: OFA family MFS transporter [Clostridiales bacterium]|nr:OFA family MFS transporter [Clostridiales bacterium]
MNQKLVALKKAQVIFFSIIIMMLLGTVYSYSVFRIAIEDAFGINHVLSGLPYMVALASYAMFMMLTGRIMNKHNPKWILLTGGLLVSVGWLLSSFAGNIVILTLTYGLIGGSGVGIAYGVPLYVVSKWFSGKRGLAVGIVLIGFGLSPLIMAPIASMLILKVGVFNTFFYLAIFLALMIPFLSMPFDMAPVRSNQQSEQHASGLIKSRNFKMLYLNFVLGTMIGLMIIGMTIEIAIEYAGVTLRNATGLISLFAVFNGLGRPIFGWIMDRYSSRKVMILAFSLVMFASVLMVSFGENEPMIFVLSFSVFWFSLGGWLSIAPSSTMKFFGMDNYGRNFGIVFTGYGIGALLGVLSSGSILDMLGSYNLIFVYTGILSVIGISTTLILGRAKQ